MSGRLERRRQRDLRSRMAGQAGADRLKSWPPSADTSPER